MFGMPSFEDLKDLKLLWQLRTLRNQFNEVQWKEFKAMNGYKTYVGIAMIAGGTAMSFTGIPGADVFGAGLAKVGYGLAGVGLAHKLAKILEALQGINLGR